MRRKGKHQSLFIFRGKSQIVPHVCVLSHSSHSSLSPPHPPPLPPSPSLPFSYSLTSELAVRDHARRVLVRQFLLQGNAHWFSLFYFVCKLLWPYYFAVASLLTILSPPSPPAEASMHFGISLCYSRAYSCQQRSGGEGVERNKHMSLLASFVRPLLKCPLKIS